MFNLFANLFPKTHLNILKTFCSPNPYTAVTFTICQTAAA